MQPLIPKGSPFRNPVLLKGIIFGALAVWLYLAMVPLIAAFSAVGRYNNDASCAFTKRQIAGACAERDLQVAYKSRARTGKAPDDFTYIDRAGRRYDFGAWGSEGGDALYNATTIGSLQHARFFEGSLVAVMLAGQPIYAVDSPQQREGLLQTNLLPPLMLALVVALFIKTYARS